MNKIHTITRFVDGRKHAFAVSRLIMLSGVPVRKYAPESPEDPVAVAKVMAVLPGLLTPEEWEELNGLLMGP